MAGYQDSKSCKVCQALGTCCHNYDDVIMTTMASHHCLLSRLFGRRSTKTSKHRVTSLVRGIHRGPVNSPHKWPVTRKMFPFDDVIIIDRNGNEHPTQQYVNSTGLSYIQLNKGHQLILKSDNALDKDIYIYAGPYFSAQLKSMESYTIMCTDSNKT